VVALVTPRHLRYHRLTQRTDDRPQTEAISSQRDYNEIETINKAGPIAMADYYVTNDGDMEKFEQQIDEICEAISF
jgi:dephospho-CoA kinase